MTSPRQRRQRIPLATALALTTGFAAAPAAMAYTDAEVDQKLDSLQQQLLSAAPRFKANGYFTFAGSVTDEKSGTYDDVSSHDMNLESLSRAALQLEFRVDNDTRFVTQLLSEGGQGWQMHAEWAFLAHDISNSTTVRAGRLRLPMFLYSETIDVGYTQPWVTGPAELYGLLQFSSYEGVDLRYRFDAAGGDWSVQPFFGYAKLNNWEGVSSDSRGDEIHGLDVTANWGDFTARVGYFGATLNIPAFPLANVAYGINDSIRESAGDGAASAAATAAASGAATGAATGAGTGAATGACAGAGFAGPALASCPASIYTPAYNAAFQSTYDSTYNSVYDSTYSTVYNTVTGAMPDPDLSVTDVGTKFWSVGLRYDDGTLLMLTEYGGSKLEGFFSDTTSCYATLGYRFGKLQPLLTWSHVRVDDPEARAFSSVAWDMDGPGPAPASANPGGAFIAQAFALDQQSTTIGLRYDASPGIALKAEASLVGEFAPGSSGQWIPDNPPAPLPDEFMVYRASLDVVF
jgi:hypothetical protein